MPALLRRLRWVNLGRLAALLAAGLLIASGGRGCRSEPATGGLERPWRPSGPGRAAAGQAQAGSAPGRSAARAGSSATARAHRRGAGDRRPRPLRPPRAELVAAAASSRPHRRRRRLHGEFTPDPGR